MKSELKWQKVTKQKLEEYKKFIDYLFLIINSDQVHFQSIIIDNHQLDHKGYSNSDKEIGFYKLYYQLLLHAFGSKYYDFSTKAPRFLVYLDERQTSYKLSDLCEILNNGWIDFLPALKGEDSY